MRVRITLEFEVGDQPAADAITYLIAHYGWAVGDDMHSPAEWVEAVVVDSIDQVMNDDSLAGWALDSSFVETS